MRVVTKKHPCNAFKDDEPMQTFAAFALIMFAYKSTDTRQLCSAGSGQGPGSSMSGGLAAGGLTSQDLLKQSGEFVAPSAPS